jgi:type VI secretion system protein VasD
MGCVFIGAALLASCKSAPPPPPPIVIKTSIVVAADANPDARQRPSPVVVRIYKLKDDDAFRNGDFFALYDKEQATLTASLVSREEFELSPGDKRSLSAALPPDVRFIGVVAGYRDIRNSEWRAEAPIVVKIPPKNAKENIINVTVNVGRSSVSMIAQ